VLLPAACREAEQAKAGEQHGVGFRLGNRSHRGFLADEEFSAGPLLILEDIVQRATYVGEAVADRCAMVPILVTCLNNNYTLHQDTVVLL
jgi:hypothetical protein